MNYQKQNDYELLYYIAEDDEHALNILYQKYHPIVVSFARKYLSLAKNRGLDYEDLVQDGLLGLSKALQYFEPNQETLFYTFACVCIEREILGEIKRNSTKRSNILNKAYSLYDVVYDSDVTLEEVIPDYSVCEPLDVAVDQECQAKLIDFKHSLSILQSEIFELRYHGFTYQEISTLLDVSFKTVDNHITRIRKKFREYWKEYSVYQVI